MAVSPPSSSAERLDSSSYYSTHSLSAYREAERRRVNKFTRKRLIELVGRLKKLSDRTIMNRTIMKVTSVKVFFARRYTYTLILEMFISQLLYYYEVFS